ncbi:MAG: ParA family protein [Deltaproteobacteria bacterium]|nr:ParA family protein [Deltaproteobacteria bacterium]
MARRVIASISRKGGVGKTTSAVSLAAALSETGRKVLLIDLDIQASASLSLGVSRENLAPSMADVLLRDQPIRGAIRSTAHPGLDLATASVDLASLEEGGSYRRSDETLLARHLEELGDGYDIVFLDCPPSFTLLSRNAVAACDGYIIPTVPHFLAVEGIRSLVQSVDRLRFRCQQGGQLLGILPTMVDYRTRLTHETLKEIRQQFGRDVFAIAIRMNVRVAEAPSQGKTIYQYDTTSTGAGAYRLAAEELLLRLDELPKAGTPQRHSRYSAGG